MLMWLSVLEATMAPIRPSQRTSTRTRGSAQTIPASKPSSQNDLEHHKADHGQQQADQQGIFDFMENGNHTGHIRSSPLLYWFFTVLQKQGINLVRSCLGQIFGINQLLGGFGPGCHPFSHLFLGRGDEFNPLLFQGINGFDVVLPVSMHRAL